MHLNNSAWKSSFQPVQLCFNQAQDIFFSEELSVSAVKQMFCSTQNDRTSKQGKWMDCWMHLVFQHVIVTSMHYCFSLSPPWDKNGVKSLNLWSSILPLQIQSLQTWPSTGSSSRSDLHVSSIFTLLQKRLSTGWWPDLNLTSGCLGCYSPGFMLGFSYDSAQVN